LIKIISTYFLLALICTLTFGVNSIYAQNDPDLEGWSAVEIDLKATKKLSFSFAEHLRLRNDITTVKNYFTQLKVNYEVLKNFELEGGVRYITKNDDVGGNKGLRSLFRYQFDASYQHKFNAITVYTRFRYQNKNRLGLSESEGDVHKEQIRFRLGVGYKIKPIKVKVRLSSELFNETESLNSEGGINRYRHVLRFSKRVKKIGLFALFYGLQDDTEGNSKISRQILGFKYSYRFKI
jgi:hypothetical protein